MKRSNLVIRKLVIKHNNLDEPTATNEEREIVHLHLRDWPDFGVPQDPQIMLKLMITLKHYTKKAKRDLPG